MKELQDIVAAFEQLKNCGKTAALATVVKVNGSTYRRPGARMLITPDGTTVGSISGGCLEQDVFERARQVMDSGEPVLVTYDTTSDDDLIWGMRLGCNGRVEVLIEAILPQSNLSPTAFLAECLRQREPGVMATIFRIEGELNAKVGEYLRLYSDGNIESNISESSVVKSILDDAQIALTSNQSIVKVYPLLAGNVEVFIEAIAPPVSLVIFGAGGDALPLVRFAKELGWYVTIVDSRSAYATKQQFPLADAVIVSRPENIQEYVQIDNRTVAVVMTHNYMHDLELLKILLPSTVRYLGMLGPKKRTEKLLQEILAQGSAPTLAQLARLYAPIGIDIGADSPEEIALAIAAEIKAVLANRTGGLLRERKAPIHTQSNENRR